ncbi:hypothetical protein K8R14_03435 [bacterium]|nr:hypothetical protein [bacterium]
MTYLLITQNHNLENIDMLTLISTLWNRKVTSTNLEINPDIHIVDGREQNSIGIEAIKDLQEEMRYKPFKETVQIAVILDAKKLTHQAQNAFLKTLEESPEQTAYILLVGSEKDLLPTIISRGKKLYTKTTHNIQDTDNLESFYFENSDLVKSFALIESLAKDKLKCIEYINSYLQALHNSFRKSIKECVNIRTITEKIDLVITTKKRINANGNRRLLLENLYLQIQELG